MKNLILTGFLALFMLGAHPSGLHATSMAEINGITTQAMRYSDQVRLNFNNSVKIDYKIDESNGACLLSLYNVPYTSSVTTGLARSIKASSKNIAGVVLSKLTADSAGEEGTQLTISFTNNNIHLNVQALEDPHQLIIDVISSNLLQNKLNGTGVIAQAFNGLHAHYAAHTLV